MPEQRRVAVVTGANRGIGREIAQQLAARHHLVAVAARTLTDAQRAAAEIGSDAFAVQLDVMDAASADAAIEAIIARTGRLDIVVNNAGGHHDDGERMSAVTDDGLRDALEVNTVGPLRVIRAALPHLRAAQWGRIVNVSSRSGSFAATWATAPAYGVSKAALNMLTVQLAKELAGSGILVNACCPGWVRTRMGGADAELSVEEGADTPVWLATLPDGGPTGAFFGERTPIEW
jgi:NAD(P)-dependent dehydrogenase (short-subunit alcohol dehydrogenase family)